MLLLLWFVGLPGQPLDVSFTDVTRGSCTLTWNAPQYDGRSAVIGYYVERFIELSWIRINSTPIRERSVSSVELFDATSDNGFRVCAVNALGDGPPSEAVSAPGLTPRQCGVSCSCICVCLRPMLP